MSTNTDNNSNPVKHTLLGMAEVTYFNQEFNSWGFTGCTSDMYETEEDAYAAYLEENAD